MTHSISVLEHDILNTGYEDDQGRPVLFQITTEALHHDNEADGIRAWRITTKQLRGSTPVGRPSSPIHVYSFSEARSLAKTLFHRHVRYLEKRVAKNQLVRLVAEENLEGLLS